MGAYDYINEFTERYMNEKIDICISKKNFLKQSIDLDKFDDYLSEKLIIIEERFRKQPIIKCNKETVKLLADACF